jgi:hypothetical protein
VFNLVTDGRGTRHSSIDEYGKQLFQDTSEKGFGCAFFGLVEVRQNNGSYFVSTKAETFVNDSRPILVSSGA